MVETAAFLFATLPCSTKTTATTSVRQTAAPAAQVNPPLRAPDTGAVVAATGRISLDEPGEGSAHGPTAATIRYPSRGTVAM